jgi:hypothetical protein
LKSFIYDPVQSVIILTLPEGEGKVELK